MANSKQNHFFQPNISLDIPGNEEISQSTRTVVELAEFHAKFNPDHIFCIQAKKTPIDSGTAAQEITYSSLRTGILNAQSWIQDTIKEAKSPMLQPTGSVNKGPPVALLMDSDASLILYIFALMRLGVPVVLLSPRLSSQALQHLVQETGARAIIASPRFQHAVSEAFPMGNDENCAVDDTQCAHELSSRKITDLHIYTSVGYEDLLGSVFQPTCVRDTDIHALHYVSDDDCQVLILHSSGTTGLPKPIYTSHRHQLSFSLCHDLKNDTDRIATTLSTSPLFHGFGLLPPWLSLGIGKPFYLPTPGSIWTGQSTVEMLQKSGAKSLLTVPSILEEIALIPNNAGIETLQNLDFVVFGGGLPKESIGSKLVSAGVKLVNHYGATETGPLAPLHIPGADYDWHYFQLRQDIRKAMEFQLATISNNQDATQNWSLSLKPLGWSERFNLQDILVSRLEDSTAEFTISGRSDDMIRLSTGEKVRPFALESAIMQNHNVKTAVAFGDSQFEIGVLVEPISTYPSNELNQLQSDIWDIIQEVNGQMDHHARVSSAHAILLVGSGSLPRSDKGTILRREVYERFEAEISDMYRRLDSAITSYTINFHSLKTDLRSLLRECLSLKIEDDQWNDDSDFFDLGIDSLQATKLRRSLAAARLEGFENDREISLHNIPNEFIYKNPSISAISSAILSGGSPAPKFDEADLIKMADLYNLKDESSKSCFLLTGTTGSLGAHLLVHLAKSPDVARIFCINRPSSENAVSRQKESLKRQSLELSESEWGKVEVLQSDTSTYQLGLGQEMYNLVERSITHVVHSAWPMNFKMQLESFHGQFRSLRNLLLMMKDAARQRPQLRPRLLFTSSISVVGRYKAVHNQTLVPEVTVQDPACTLPLGYAKAKLVCERIVDQAKKDIPTIELGYVRLGQIAGSHAGFWNSEEHLVSILASSQKLGSLPDLHGTFSWIPVNTAAATICDIMKSMKPLALVYHLENPIRQSWRDAIWYLSEEMNVKGLLPFRGWLDRVSEMPDADNPAKNLIDFLEANFEHMSCGGVILDTSVSRATSQVLQQAEGVSVDVISRYLAFWKSTGVLQ